MMRYHVTAQYAVPGSPSIILLLNIIIPIGFPYGSRSTHETFSGKYGNLLSLYY